MLSTNLTPALALTRRVMGIRGGDQRHGQQQPTPDIRKEWTPKEREDTVPFGDVRMIFPT